MQATHAEVGAYLLDLWGLPAPLVEAVALHHQPSLANDSEFSSLTAVHAANVFAHEATGVGAGVDEHLDLPYLESLGLGDRPETWRAELADS